MENVESGIVRYDNERFFQFLDEQYGSRKYRAAAAALREHWNVPPDDYRVDEEGFFKAWKVPYDVERDGNRALVGLAQVGLDRFTCTMACAYKEDQNAELIKAPAPSLLNRFIYLEPDSALQDALLHIAKSFESFAESTEQKQFVESYQDFAENLRYLSQSEMVRQVYSRYFLMPDVTQSGYQGVCR